MFKPATNSIFEADFSKMMNPSKIMGEFKMPGFEMNALMEMQRKNVEMITTINQAIAENLQAFAHRHAEFMQQGFEEATNLMNAVMSASSPQEKVIRQAEASKDVVEKCIANARDATETLAKCNSQTIETISNRMTDGVKELQGLMKTSVAA
jgi:phasin family protein